MKVALIGLGKMGGNMARRLRLAGHDVVGFNQDTSATATLAKEAGLIPADSLEDAVSKLSSPKVVWVMLPSGDATNGTLDRLQGLLSAGDVVIEGGNSNYNESIKNAAEFKKKGIYFVDAGVSGGVWGLKNGYTLMVGGEVAGVAAAEPLLRSLAPSEDKGWLHCGPSGAGHFTKMIHNGIEYGMMQAYAEGFALMKNKTDLELDIAKIAELWRHGSVVRSWLLDLTADFLATDQTLDNIEAFVQDSGEGRWTVDESIAQGIPAPVIALAVMRRFASQGKADFSEKLLAMMRKGFGGHAVKGD